MITWLTLNTAIGIWMVLGLWSTYNNLDVVVKTTTDQLRKFGKTIQDVGYLIPIFSYTLALCYVVYLVAWLTPVAIVWFFFGV